MLSPQLEVDTVACFSPLNDALAEVLRGLTPAEWAAPTHFPHWKVKDIVAHLLDTSLRRLSSQRDQYRPRTEGPLGESPDLVTLITRMADRWVEATALLSPSILTELTLRYQDELAAFFQTLDLDAPSPIPVSWAGQTASSNRFDVSREFTERWHHQMQIREALGKPLLLGREHYHPVLATFMLALPYHYSAISGSNGYRLEVTVTGEAGGSWTLEWDGPRRILGTGRQGRPDTRVVIEPEVAWKVFTRFNDSLYEKRFRVEGDRAVGEHLFTMKCILID